MSRSSWLIASVSSRRRRSSSRAMRTRIVCSARASRRPIRVLHVFENSAPPGSRSSGHCRCQSSVLLGLDAMAHEAFAVVAEQPQVQLRSGQLRGRKGLQALLQRGAGHGEGVDRVRLAALAGAPACLRGQVRRDPQHPLAALDEKPLERPGDVPAVLTRPHPLLVTVTLPSITTTSSAVSPPLIVTGPVMTTRSSADAPSFTWAPGAGGHGRKAQQRAARTRRLIRAADTNTGRPVRATAALAAACAPNMSGGAANLTQLCSAPE